MAVDTLSPNPHTYESMLPDDVQAMYALGNQFGEIARLKRDNELTSIEALDAQTNVAESTIKTVVACGRYCEEEARGLVLGFLGQMNGEEAEGIDA